MDINKNYYDILGVNKNSSESDIKKAYRKKANLTHPDKHGGDDSEFKSINEAYQVLGDRNKKQQYDSRSPHGNNFAGNFSSFDTFGFGNAFTIFEQFFNGGFNYAHRQDFKEDLDIIVNIDIDLKKIYNNEPVTIKYERQVRCNDCKGTGFDRNSESFECEVCDGKGRDVYGFRCEQCLGEGKIYSGTCKTCNGNKVLLKEQEITLEKTYTIRQSTRSINRGFGHHSRYYREKSGSLIVNINFINDKYEIKGYDLHFIKNVHFQDAINGNDIIHEHVDDSKIKITLPKNTNDGDIIRLNNKGLLKEDSTRGDLYIKVNIIIDYDRI